MELPASPRLSKCRPATLLGVCLMATGLLYGDATLAQDRPVRPAHVEQAERDAVRRAESYERRRAAAHARMPNTMYASTPTMPIVPHASRDALERLRRIHRGPLVAGVPRSGQWPRAFRRGLADDETAEDVFREHVSPVVQDRCINCHVADGMSSGTRLVFVPASDADHLSVNQTVFEGFVAQVDDGGQVILNKIRGVGHGGATQVPIGSSEYGHFERFLALLGEDVGSVGGDLATGTLFDGVGMITARSLLRRAALIFAGRTPTAGEYDDLQEVGLPAAIRKLMTGSGFHEFLIRAGNDRLLTDREDRHISESDNGPFVAYANMTAVNCEAAAAGVVDPEWEEWERAVQYGAGRAPLELIAHVVENDLPYTEILTADYIMANPQAAQAYGANTVFDDPTDIHEFRPSKYAGYHLTDDSRMFRETDSDCQRYIVDPGNLHLDYPHAGILNTPVFMKRYPTTATNRNRARSRWTYYHFLGLDVEKSASRTTDPEALKDTNNPTFNNPNCTVCHIRLDPVAGTFQNYDEEGHYRAADGTDSLDWDYKENPPGGEDVLIEARSWEKREVARAAGYLTAGANTVGLRVFAHDHVELGLDRLTVRDDANRVRQRIRLGGLRGVCGHREQQFHVVDGGCILAVPVNVSAAGTYTVEVEAWIWHQDGRYPARLRMWVPGHIYEEGDTWYRDMRAPGIGTALAPDADNSVAWLARQIVARDGFAEAAVKFWWPAIHGSEVLTTPDATDDADFAGIALAADAQRAEIERLAAEFRTGIRGGAPFNLKDLLVEMVMSEWFRADSIPDDHPVRSVALLRAGAKRLLTPEELASKTLALTGVQWGRQWREPWHDVRARHTALTHDYATLYGGIDSDGITQRARDMTAVMAGVAQLHAVELSCPIVLRELYLLADEDRLLFDGIDQWVTPVSEFGGSFEIAGSSRSSRQTVSLSGPLKAGEKLLRVAFLNDYWDEETEDDRNLRLHRMVVRKTDDRSVVRSYEFSKIRDPHCGDASYDHYALWGECAVEVPFELQADGDYTVEVTAWADQAGDELARARVQLESTDGRSAGALSIRRKLGDLHDKLIGVRPAWTVTDTRATYELFKDVWGRQREKGHDDFFSDLDCDWTNDQFFLDGILAEPRVRYTDEEGRLRYDWDWNRINRFWESRDFSDPNGAARTWVVVLMALLMDQRYLHL